MQLSPPSRHSIPLWPKYSLQKKQSSCSFHCTSPRLESGVYGLARYITKQRGTGVLILRNEQTTPLHQVILCCLCKSVNPLILIYFNREKFLCLSHNIIKSRLQLPTCLEHELSSPAATLRIWVQIPHESCISLCFILCEGGDLGTV
jgi:hypothetical protein